MEQISRTHMTYLQLFSPKTYGISIPQTISRPMEAKGLVEWVPPKFGTQLWGITSKGREVRKASTE